MPSQSLHTRRWTVDILIFEAGSETTAEAVLHADAPSRLTARGASQRGGGDPSVPEIGDEVAVARALRNLAEILLSTAESDIEAVTGEEDVAVRPR